MLKSGYIALICLLLLCYGAKAQPAFVQVKGHQFVIAGKPYYYIGANYWYGGLLALQKDPKRGKERLVKELDFLKAKGINNLRVLAGSEGVGIVDGVDRIKPSLQPAHNQYNVQVLEGLDYLLFEMGKRNMHAVLYLSNNWDWSGGFLQYLNWNKVITDQLMQSKMAWTKLQETTSKFYTCDACQTDYRQQVSYILKHVNKYTGQTYINDPTIMAWELANEPRPMVPSAIGDYEKWTSATATFIKSLDKNHLVTLGTEGDIGTENADVYKTINTPQQVDYLTIHIWPKNWSWFQDTSMVKSLPQVIQNALSYVDKHEAIAKQLDKPLVLEEFGLPRDRQAYTLSSSTNSRNKLYDAMFTVWQKSVSQSGCIAGCNIWAYGGLAVPRAGQLFWKDGDDYLGDPPQEEQGLNSVFNSDAATWKIVESYSRPVK
jgi:mannan endo-1,4-beta-mannosidase